MGDVTFTGSKEVEITLKSGHCFGVKLTAINAEQLWTTFCENTLGHRRMLALHPVDSRDVIAVDVSAIVVVQFVAPRETSDD